MDDLGKPSCILGVDVTFNSDGSIKKTNAAREPFFLDLADIVIDTSNLNENEVTQQILSSLKSKNEN